MENGKKKLDKVIEIFGVCKVYDGVTVVDNMNLSIKRGEFVTLLGPSGCGKTTLLRMIAGLTDPTQGRIFLDGIDVTDLPPHKRQINTIFQKYALFPHLNVFKNVAFGLKLKKIEIQNKDKKGNAKFRHHTRAEMKQKVEAALKLVGLEDYGHRDVNSLSGGQQQRVAIARALVLEPRVLLLDEPLGALDLKMRKEMQSELKKMHKQSGITFVYVTHDQEEALTMSDNVAVIKDGAIQQYNTPQKIYDEPSNAFVADFIGESNILSGIMRGDFSVEFLSTKFQCMDKGFGKNETVDLVIRPEDITIYPAGDKRGQLAGRVVYSVFKGTFYEMEVLVEDYQFTVQSTTNAKAGSAVLLYIAPDGIHIMKKVRTINTYITKVTGENTVEICGGDFEFINNKGFERGDSVQVSVAFDKVELTDDEEDGVIGGNIAQSLYKGKYYQVQVYTDDDQDFFVDTADEWDNDDRVGIRIKPEDILVEKYAEGGEDE
ncbi:MAG: ABC transporter ATP-binding protein [Firmicutes bacterium]|nr:ABC transporter ATP-binding protein [Bacillota bacterium]